MLKIVVLVSGGGTNLQAVIDGVKGGAISNTEMPVRWSAPVRMGSAPAAYPQKITNPERCSMQSFWRLWIHMSPT